MKINGQYHSYSEPLKSKNAEQKSQPEKLQKNQESVELNLSPAAKNILATTQNEASSSARIQEIKAAIQNGTYQVSPEKIAASLTQTMVEQSELK